MSQFARVKALVLQDWLEAKLIYQFVGLSFVIAVLAKLRLKPTSRQWIVANRLRI